MIPHKDIPNFEKIIKEKNIIIKNLEEENLLLKTKNKLLEEIIKKNNLSNDIPTTYNISNPINIENKRKSIYYDSKEEIYDKDNSLNNTNIFIHTPPDSPEKNKKDFFKEKQTYYEFKNDIEGEGIPLRSKNTKIIINNFDNNKYKRFMLLSFICSNKNIVENILNKYRKKETQKVKRKRAKKPNLRDKTYEIKERLPITIFKNIKNNLVYKTIAAETSLRLKLAHEIAELTKRNSEMINYKEIIDYIISQSGTKLDSKSITRLRRKYERSWDIYDIYGEKLNTLKFSIYVFSEIDDEDYKKWKLYLAEIINGLPKQCNYIFRKGDNKGNICGIYDCPTHNGKKNINDEK